MQCDFCGVRFKKDEGKVWERTQTYMTTHGIETIKKRRELCDKHYELVSNFVPCCPTCDETMAIEKWAVSGKQTLYLENSFSASFSLGAYSGFQVVGQDEDVVLFKLTKKCVNYKCDSWSVRSAIRSDDPFIKHFGRFIFRRGEEIAPD